MTQQNPPFPRQGTTLMKIALRGCRFFARHGVMPHERVAGNEFEVSLEAVYASGDPLSDSIADTISYADLYDIARSEMEQPSELLENAAARIVHAVRRRWPKVQSVSVTVVKVSPPIPGFTGTAEVTCQFSV